jgi:nucleotide-binding universal stress UspA family protein
MDQAEPHPAVGPPDPADKRQRPGPDPVGPGPGQELDNPVIAGFDGSPSSRNALAYAAGMARRVGRPLLVVYVSPRDTYCEPLTGQVIGSASDRDEIGRWLVAELAQLSQVCDRDGLRVRALIRCGTPARELAAAASEWSADALVIGASSQAWHQLAGSVPGWLAKHVRCPLIVVP